MIIYIILLIPFELNILILIVIMILLLVMNSYLVAKILLMVIVTLYRAPKFLVFNIA